VIGPFAGQTIAASGAGAGAPTSGELDAWDCIVGDDATVLAIDADPGMSPASVRIDDDWSDRDD
jgi:hypothetical protein